VTPRSARRLILRRDANIEGDARHAGTSGPERSGLRLYLQCKLKGDSVAQRKRGAAKMGRPPAPPEDVRRNRVVVFVRDSELAALHRLADSHAQPLGTVAYELLAKSLRRAK
jgi:hypothetical protein